MKQRKVIKLALLIAALALVLTGNIELGAASGIAGVII